MTLYRAVRAVASASGEGIVDWDAVGEAARTSTDPGELSLSASQRRGYAADVRDARDRITSASGREFPVPTSIEVQNRHHWINTNVDTFRRVMAPLEEHADAALPGVARVLNTGSMTVTLSFLARNVLGQYDPVLLVDAPRADHGLYFVHPNVVRVADELDVAYPRFRRWIAFHEVAHAAEFGAAPWLSDHLSERIERGVGALADGTVDRSAFSELQTAMTAVEGYAELLMDEAFDEDPRGLREKLEERRRGGTPVDRLLRRLLGLGMKRRQYERGRAFFDAVVEARGIEAAGAVWDAPDRLPTDAELDAPERWLRRVDP